MYQSPQKKSSSWTPASIQKKSKSFSKPGSSSVQPKRDAKSAQSQDMPSYSTPGADLLTGSIMRSVETEDHSEVLDSTGKRQSEPGRAAVAAIAPPIVSIPVVQPNSVGIQRQCSECASQQQQQSGEEGKDVLEMSEAASGIQTKLTIGAIGDVYEQEADRVAAQVMSMPVAAAAPPQVQRFGEEPSPVGMYSSLARSITPVVQRRVEEQVQMYSRVQRAFQAGGNEASVDLESRLNASKGGGSALAPEVRAFMEPRFGTDFSSVRVHTGGEAVQMNRELGAQAFAHGSDIYFGAGKSPGNNELTAHELTHVVQQAPSQTISRKPDVYTEWLNQQADVIRSGLDAGTREGMHQAFDRLNSLNMQNMLDVLVILQQQKQLPELRVLLPECGLGEAAINRMKTAMDSVEQVSSTDSSKLPPDQKKTVEAFGKASPGTSGDDPDRNTYVVYDGFIKTYFMTSVERKQRSSAWLANNPGNMDRTGDVVGIGKGMKWGKHTFAIFTTLDDGKAALRDHLLRYKTLDSYLNFHLGIRADGSNADGNNKTIYLQHIQAKAKFATASTNPQLLEAGQMSELLEGFYNAEGSSRPGNILTSSDATIDDSMNPIQKKCMRFYQILLGLRAP